ncbi:hypothetical protein [Streptomyces sp. S465]|uniref:hypothetical protein n=1 Tax=Streptomyces sp. S465 TaxID=2979468 RepID=UPI0022A891CB|nr:hypothetical protein [Streptomyces sp. S465]WAP57271.1 hypothetical protein N6H00_21195 [Streptomyces sp. S465]
MSDELRVQGWLAESRARLDEVRVERPMPGREVRLRGARRRRRRVLSATAAALSAATCAGVVCWHVLSAERTAVRPARPAESAGMTRVREELRSYYSALPGTVAAQGETASATKLSQLLATHFTSGALRQEEAAARTPTGTDGPAATCGRVTAHTTFTVGDPHRTGTDTARVRVVRDGGPEAIDIEFDLRVMKISKWSCPNGS